MIFNWEVRTSGYVSNFFIQRVALYRDWTTRHSVFAFFAVCIVSDITKGDIYTESAACSRKLNCFRCAVYWDDKTRLVPHLSMPSLLILASRAYKNSFELEGLQSKNSCMDCHDHRRSFSWIRSQHNFQFSLKSSFLNVVEYLQYTDGDWPFDDVGFHYYLGRIR